jgi:DNA repair protein RecO (recombination protein O)
VEAVVLRHNDWGEADRMLGLFTHELGKVRAVAKGVRKLRSRKAGHLEPFTRASLQLARGREILIVTQAETLDSFISLREDLPLLGYTSYIIELLDRFTYEEGENASLYRLLVDTLTRLAAGHPPERVVHYYEVRLLDLLGFRPQLFQCARCGKDIQAEDQYFSAELGGVVCASCGKGMQGAVPVSMQALKFLRHFQRSSYAEAARANPQGPVYREMEVLMQHYLTYLLERGLNTPSFLRRVRRQETLSE